MFATLALFTFPMLMAFAAFSDLLTMRISNRLVLVLAAGFFIVAFSIHLPVEQIAMHFAGAALVLVVAFCFSRLGGLAEGTQNLPLLQHYGSVSA